MNATEVTRSRTGRRGWLLLAVVVVVVALAATWPAWLGVITANPGATASYDTATGELAVTDTAADGASVIAEYCWADASATRCDDVLELRGQGVAEGQTTVETVTPHSSHIVYRACRDAPLSIRACTSWTTAEAAQPSQQP